MIRKLVISILFLSISLFASKKDANNLAEYIANAYFDLDINSVKKISTTFLNNNKNVKAFYIDEDGEKFLSAYKIDDKIVFVPLLPSKYTKLENYSASIKYKGRDIGKVKLFYESSKVNNLSNSINQWKGISDSELNLKLTNHEKLYLSAKKFISICVDPSWMPYEKIEKGKYIGIGADYIKLFEEKINVKFKLIETKTWEESKQKAKNKECEVLPLSSLSKKRKEFMHITEPYLIQPIVLATKINSKFVTSVEELRGKKIGITKGYSIINTLKEKYPFLEIIETENIIDGLNKVNEGKLFGQIDAILTLNYYIQDELWNKIKISGQLEEKYELGIASNKNDIFLHNILTKLVQSISKYEHRQISNKWNIKEKIIEKTDYTLLFQVLIVLISVIVFIMFWNYRLKKIVEMKTQELKQLNDNLEQRVLIEIEKNRQNELSLLEQAKLAQMGEMIGNIAHQWRQPLSAISSYSSSLKLLSKLDNLSKEEIENTADNISEKTKYLSKTIDTFRNFLIKEKEKKVLILQNTIDEAINVVEATLKEHNINLIKNIDYKTPHQITLVQGELEQVLINIINNSKDILIEKNNNLNSYIKIELIKEKDKYIITIEDNGGGIPDNIINKVFDPYFTTKHKKQGTGLGLHMSYRIVTDSLEGNIYLKNTQKGAKFFIELPL